MTLTIEQIEALRWRFKRGMIYEAEEIEALCDMALASLSYVGDETLAKDAARYRKARVLRLVDVWDEETIDALLCEGGV